MFGTRYSMFDRPGGLRYFCRGLRLPVESYQLAIVLALRVVQEQVPPHVQTAGDVRFAVVKVRVVPAQPVLANLIGTRMKVRDDDPGMVDALAAHDLAARERIDSPEPSLEGQAAVDPTRLQFREVLDGQLGSDGSGAASRDSVSERFY
jgi:hypothetical protein